MSLHPGEHHLERNYAKKVREKRRSNPQQLSNAAAYGDAENLAIHIQNCDINAAPNGMSALHFAAANGHMNCVQMLVEAGANVNACSNEHGITPLHSAAKLDFAHIVRYLVQNGADPNLKGKSGSHGKTATALSPSRRGHAPPRDLFQAGWANTGILPQPQGEMEYVGTVKDAFTEELPEGQFDSLSQAPHGESPQVHAHTMHSAGKPTIRPGHRRRAARQEYSRSHTTVRFDSSGKYPARGVSANVIRSDRDRPDNDTSNSQDEFEFANRNSNSNSNSGSSNKKPLGDMSVGDVCDLLSSVGLGAYSKTFARQDIDGGTLSFLTEVEDMVEVGIKYPKQQKLLRETIDKARKSGFTSTAVPFGSANAQVTSRRNNASRTQTGPRSKRQIAAAHAYEEEALDAYGKRGAPSYAQNGKIYSNSERYY